MNRLADETSPYLRQHRHNPVDWYPWGPDAFAEAERRDVPILLSIGYSACHWCHVMAHECFEDTDVAAVMNEKFVNVKVDREERPDIDSLYMDALQALTGRGGWPLTMFLTPHREPFFGGTYYPRAQFLALLDAVAKVYRDQPGDVATNVAALRRAIIRSGALQAGTELPTIEQVNAGVQAIARAVDREWGGFGQAPKFPATFNIELLLRALVSSGSDFAREAVTTTLDAMASGGIYDHIGGGFARYSVDRAWRVPHFEKMLYDQALFMRVYLHGFMVLGKPQWRLVLEETITYVLTQLRDEHGGLYSSEDADSPDAEGNGVEGLFYTWTPSEARAALGDLDPRLTEAILDWFDITDEGNFEGRSIPNRIAARGALVRPREIEEGRRALFTARARRRRPGLDDKVLTEWNALLLSALSEAAAVFGRHDWLDAAIAIGEFLVTELRDEHGRWYRSWHRDGVPKVRHAALAADHAALVDAFTRLAEASGQARWIDEAVRTAETMLEWFWDPVEGGLHTTAEDAEELIARQKDLDDNATPSANSSAAIALLRLAALTGELRYRTHAERIMHLIEPQLGKAGMYSGALIAADLAIRGVTEVVIVGDRDDLVTATQRIWRPDKVVAWGEPFDSPLWEGRSDGFAYVCRDFTCQAPVDTVDGVVEALIGRKPVTSDGGG